VRSVAWFVGALLCSAVLTGLVRRWSQALGRLDIPNARSSHTTPTPRGGGLGIAIPALAACIALSWLGALGTPAAAGALIGGALVAGVGYLDDVRGMSALARFSVHITAAVTATAWLLMSPGVPFFPAIPQWLAVVVLVVAIAWSINLFNFMDGIDGIAASQSAFMGGAGAALVAANGPTAGWSDLAVATSGASVGFLLWNWPPARIFMGDIGSGFLGFWLTILAIGLHSSGLLPIWTSLILGSAFVADASVTLLRRLLRGERWYEAHRSHAYQIMAARWRSHLKVVVALWILNVGVILPFALLSLAQPRIAAAIACGLVAALAAACALIGAGRSST
jgi:Fuc2NAc and GlcNAc transferase